MADWDQADRLLVILIDKITDNKHLPDEDKLLLMKEVEGIADCLGRLESVMYWSNLGKDQLLN